MHAHLPGNAQIMAQQVGIRVARQQDSLKEQHAGGPDGRTATVPRQDQLADDRLHKKHGDRADQHRDRARPGEGRRAFTRHAKGPQKRLGFERDDDVLEGRRFRFAIGSARDQHVGFGIVHGRIAGAYLIESTDEDVAHRAGFAAHRDA